MLPFSTTTLTSLDSYELKKLKLYYYFFELLKPFLACIIKWKSSSKTVRMKDTKTKVE